MTNQNHSDALNLPVGITLAPCEYEQLKKDAERLSYIESQNGFQRISKFITWRNGEDEYDGIERSYWEVEDQDDQVFRGSTFREAIDIALTYSHGTRVEDAPTVPGVQKEAP